MNSTFTLPLALFLFCCLPFQLSAQTGPGAVWPGDANNDGLVSHPDLLYFGHAFGAQGPVRSPGGGSWSEQAMSQAWPDDFPDATNFVYGDGNGDGRINYADLSILFNNRGRLRAGADSTIAERLWTLPDSSGAHRAIIRLESAGIQVLADGNYLEVDVVVTGLNGTAFSNFYSLAIEARFQFNMTSFDDAMTDVTELVVNPKPVPWTRMDSLSRLLTFAYTHVDRSDHEVDGSVYRLRLPVPAGVSLDEVKKQSITVEKLILVDANFQSYRAAVDPSTPTGTTPCSFTVSPVAGANGVTYLNACFAEAAGVMTYTPGACWNPGISVSAMNPGADCPDAYDPVCGFNGITYPNACAAEAAGVTRYEAGTCSGTNTSCYDPNLILISSGTSLNRETGVISLSCATADEPVCGCDGEEYASACLAEAAGVRNYTHGACDDLCVDPMAIADNDHCPAETAFVCGCNGETYINACFAETAGVQDYTVGPCNGASTWCAEAVVINCGDYLPGESTVGAGNQLTSYPGAHASTQAGPDRVYVFEKTTAGDLQIGLEIITPGLNMDLFLLTGDCNNYTVVGASTLSNQQTNNEGIVFRDAPNGTYYVVVDQVSAGVGGEYNLELSCGYLNCSERVPLSCGVTYHGTNAGGNDDVSTYTCGRSLNVENNGPEIVHSFTTTEEGLVTISLTNLDANLELFLLSECSRRMGLEFSQNAGSYDEQIERRLPAGTYYVVVDGYNGAVSDYSLTVNCTASCDMGYEVLSQSGAACGGSGGNKDIQVITGSPYYTAHYVGPVCRTVISSNGAFNFTHLPPGDYATIVTDGSGCEMTFHFTISATGGGIDAYMAATDATCGEGGKIDVTMTTPGTRPYVVHLGGDVNRTYTTTSNRFAITPLEAGHYVVTVTDANGCSVSESLTVNSGDGNLGVTAYTEPAGCTGNLGEIVVRATGGSLPFTVRLQGPVTGGRIVHGYNFRVLDLPAGTYALQLTDAYGCTYHEQLTVGGGVLEATVSATAANCDLPGAIRVQIGTGHPPYTINYTGPASGSVTETMSSTTLLTDLPAGTYNLSIWDANGCDRSVTVFVEDSGGNLDLSFSQTLASCDGSDARILLDVSGGQPNYTVTYSGTETGSVSIDGTGSQTLDLPPGNYTVTATDFSGCSVTQHINVLGGLTSGSQNSFAYGDGCGQQDNIRTLINSGEAPYQVTLTADACPSTHRNFVAQTNNFVITDLPNCTYTIAVVDANGCASSQTVTIDVDPEADFFTLTPRNGACGGLGGIFVEVNAGDGPYFVEWSGAAEGTVNMGSQTYLATGLPAGTYTFHLRTQDGCEATATTTLLNDGSLEIVSSVVTDDCGQPDQIWNDIEGGSGPYDVTVTRLCDNTEVDVIMSGNGFEVIDLIPCDYKLAVTDRNGCMTMSVVTVDPYQLFFAVPTDGVCGGPGSVTLEVTNASASGPYRVDFTGPAFGSTSDADGLLTLNGLVAGTYELTVTSAEGCTESETVVVENQASDLDLQTALITNDCGQYNQLWNDIHGGQAPYSVVVTRLCDNVIDTTFTTSDNGFELFDLVDCCYRVAVTDAQGCTDFTERCVGGDQPNLFNASAVPGPCGEDGRIDLNFVRGQAPYTVTYTGPQSGDNNTVNGNQLSINDAPSGTYTFTVTDANGCRQTETIDLDATTNNLELSAALIVNECGQYNQVWIDIFNGTGPFSIEVIRLCDGTTMTEFVSGEVGFELFDLDPCDYKIVVTDAAGCMVMDVVEVGPSPIDLVDLDFESGNCTELGSFDLTITRGTAPYTIVYTGPVRDSFQTSQTTFSRADLPSGSYTLTVTDALDCTDLVRFTIDNNVSDLDLLTALIANDCGQYNQIWNDIVGGEAPFDVEVTRLCDGTTDTTFTTDGREFELFDLESCDYKITVTDATGCMDMETVSVRSASANLYDITVDNSCDNSGFQLSFIGGAPPYRVVVAGPVMLQFTDVTEDFFVAAPPGDYSIRAFSSENCTEMSFAGIEADDTGQLPSISFAPNVSGPSVSFTNNSQGTSFSWNFGDGSPVSTESHPQHTYGAAGEYVACLTVSNGCGDNTACQTVRITETNSARLVIGQAVTAVNNSVRVPIYLEGVENLATIAGTFSLSDPSIATISHVTGGAILPQFNPQNHSFSYVANGTDGVDLSGGTDLLFYLHLDAHTNLGSTVITLADQPVSFELSGLQASVPVLIATSFQAGNLEVSANVLGNISTHALTMDDTPVDQTAYQLSEEDGSYVIDLPVGNNGIASTLTGITRGRMYYIEPVKTTDYRNGLSSFEIFLAQRHLLGFEVPQITDPMQLVSLDVNCSQSFSNLDLYILQRLLVDDLDAIPGCNSWTFVPDSHTFPTDWQTTGVFPAPRRAEVMLTSDTMVMFTAVKTGDLLGDANPERHAEDLPLAIAFPHDPQSGGVYELPVTLAADADLVSFQGDLRLSDDLELLAVSGLSFGELMSNGELGVRDLTRLSWFSPSGEAVPLRAGSELFTITVRVQRQSATTSGLVAFADTPGYAREAHDGDYQRLRPIFTVGSGAAEPTFVVHGAVPNPATDNVEIRFSLPTTGQVELLLVDGLGRTVLRRQQDLSAGDNSFRLDTRSIPAGVYHFRLGAADQTAGGKLVVRR